jgi:hypothetical protein
MSTKGTVVLDLKTLQIQDLRADETIQAAYATAAQATGFAPLDEKVQALLVLIRAINPTIGES